MRSKLLIITLLLVLFSFSSASAQAVNLTLNSGFDEGNSKEISHWIGHAWGDEPGISDFKLDEKEKHSGKSSALIINNSPTDARLKQEIKVKENTYYKLSCWIKTENVGTSSKGANISVEGITDTSNDVNGTSDWQKVELYGKTDKRQESFTITLGLGGYGSLNTGKAWFDDVMVEELPKAPQGISLINFFAVSSQTAGEVLDKLPVVILILITFTALLTGILFIYIINNKKHSNTGHTAQFTAFPSDSTGFRLKLDSRDYMIMLAMTIIYLCISLFNLGSLKVPQTSWKPSSTDESFILDFGKTINIEKISYYSGIGDGKFRVEYMNDAGKYVPLSTIETKDIFNWRFANASVQTGKLKFIVDTPGLTLNEICIFEQGKNKPLESFSIVDIKSGSYDTGTVQNLFDEQNTAVYRSSYKTGMYFDEIYHARTAFEHINRMQPYEWTHPPLGKIIIASGIMLFGMNPFGWRIMGTLFGVLMIPLMYAFGKKLFNARFYGFCSAFLMMFDFMHFTQTRIATIDVYGTFFIILMYYYMLDYFMNTSYITGFKQSLKPLFLSGLFFGIGAACKWIALYGGAGLAVLFFTSRFLEYRNYSITNDNSRDNKSGQPSKFARVYLFGTIPFCILFFVLIPAAIYYISYIPYMLVPGSDKGLKFVLDYQIQMYNYHSKLVATHSFSSPWYEWPIIYKPTWFYSGSDLPVGKVSTIVTMGNPAIWWIGTFAIVIAVVIALYKKDKKMAVVFTALIFQFIPWILVSRITWIYHFFSTVPFMILSIVYVIKNIMENFKNSYYIIYIYLGLTAILFIWFYPALSGLEVDKTWIDSLKWFKTWIF